MNHLPPRISNVSRATLPRRLYGSLALLAVFAAVMMACGFGPAADTSAGPPATPTATTAPAATDAPVAPTPTNVPATPTPIPPLKSQIITKSLGTINPGANSAITDIACPSGYLVAGGGPKSGYSNFTMMWNAPLNTTTWRAEANNDGASAINVDEEVTCLSVAGLHSQIVTKTLGSVDAHTNSTITDIACPSGYLVAGGGPKSGYSNFTMMWNAPINTTTWRAEAYNDASSGTINVDVQIACLAVSGLHSQIITKSLGNIGAGTNSPITDASCASGYLVAGSGPNSGYSNFTLMWNAPLSTTTTRSEANNDNSSGVIFVQMQIVCLKH